MSLWNDANTELLKRMHMAGKSSREIRDAIGLSNLSRSAVQGKIHRLGLSRLSEKIKDVTNAILPASLTQDKGGRPRKKNDKAGNRPAIKTVYDVSNARIDQTPLATSEPCTVMTARPDQCRWPIVVEGSEVFCGAAIHKGSFCVDHARRAYTRDE